MPAMTPRYVKDGDAEIILLGARDDPPQNNPVYLKDVAEFSKAATGVDCSQRGMAFDSVEAQGYPLGEYVVQFGPIAVAAISGPITA
jgi:hypothetical protein